MIVGGLILKAVTTKGAAAGAAKVGATKATLATASSGAAKATVTATHYAALNAAAGAGLSTTTIVVLGSCMATSTMLAIATCLSRAVDAYRMSESYARDACEKISQMPDWDRNRVVQDMERTSPERMQARLDERVYRYDGEWRYCG